MEIDAKFLQLILEVGILAGGYSYTKQAEVIFDGLRAVRPENESPLIGLALTKISSNRPEDAIRILEEDALKVNPESDLARSFLGLALKLTGREAQSMPILKEVVERNRDVAAVNLAKGILDEIESP